MPMPSTCSKPEPISAKSNFCWVTAVFPRRRATFAWLPALSAPLPAHWIYSLIPSLIPNRRRPLRAAHTGSRDIVRAHGEEFRRAHAESLSVGQKRVLRAIERCRTAALGGHLERCDQCGHERNAYNSCVMGSNSLWGVEERLSGRSKLFSLIQAVVDGCRLPITNRPFCGWDMQIAMR